MKSALDDFTGSPIVFESFEKWKLAARFSENLMETAGILLV